MAITSESARISEESDDNNSDFSDIPVLSVRINDENGFSDSSEENQAERGVEPYQYEPEAESDSNSVSETRIEAASTAVNRDVDRHLSTEW